LSYGGASKERNGSPRDGPVTTAPLSQLT